MRFEKTSPCIFIFCMLVCVCVCETLWQRSRLDCLWHWLIPVTCRNNCLNISEEFLQSWNKNMEITWILWKIYSCVKRKYHKCHFSPNFTVNLPVYNKHVLSYLSRVISYRCLKYLNIAGQSYFGICNESIVILTNSEWTR